MSYDLMLLKPRTGESLEEAFYRVTEADEAEFEDPGPVDPATEDRKSKMAAAIRAAAPSLMPFARDYSAIAAAEQCTEEDSRRRWRSIELNEEPETTLGLQVTVGDDHIDITIPYWHTGPKAEEVFALIGRICEAVRGRWGLSVYDPQLDREVRFPDDLAEMVKGYTRTIREVHPLLPPGVEPIKPAVAAARARRWWEFWRK